MRWLFLLGACGGTVTVGFKLWAGMPLDGIDKLFATVGMIGMCIDQIVSFSEAA